MRFGFFFVDAWSTVTSDFANLLKNADSYLHNIQSSWFGRVQAGGFHKEIFFNVDFLLLSEALTGWQESINCGWSFLVSRRCLWLFLFTVLVCWNFAYKFQTFLDSKKCVLFQTIYIITFRDSVSSFYFFYALFIQLDLFLILRRTIKSRK